MCSSDLLPLGFIGTVEFLYSKSVNDLVYEKINLKDPVAGNDKIADDGRTLWGGTNSGNGNFFDVLMLTNTNQGYQYSLTFQLQRTVARGVSVNTAYTFGQSKDVNSVLSSQARSQIRRNPIVNNPNDPPLGYSRFDPGHRVFASIAFTQEFFDNAPTTISIFYNGQSGQRFSFTVDNDLNNDGFDNSYNSGNSERSYKREKTPEELRQELYGKEKRNPDEYLSVEYSLKYKVWSSKDEIKGRIYNSATIATFKDVVLKVTFSTGTNTSLGSEDYVVYKYVYPGRSTPFEIKIILP